jgi:hypothetical protein
MAQPNPFSKKGGLVFQPLCPTCGHRIWFMKLSKLDNAHDIRTFKCHGCEHTESEIVTLDVDS